LAEILKIKLTMKKNKPKYLTDGQILLDELFNYLNDLPEDEVSIPDIYASIIMDLIDNIEYNDKFQFKLPSEEDNIYICLNEKVNILKVLDYIIEYFHRYEIYEMLENFNMLRDYYINEYIK
jgi:aspartate carbamoyltransferase regulatory subunit